MSSSRIEWSRKAVLDKRRLIQRLKKEYPPAIEKAEQRITNAIELLGNHPKIGTLCQGVGLETLRDFHAPFGKNAYTIRYQITPQTIYIVRILHGREMWPNGY